MELIKCCYCKKEKSISEFHKDRQKKNGYRPRCKVCDRFSINLEQKHKYEKKYWDKNRERKREIVKKSIDKNKAHHAKIKKIYLSTEKGIASRRKCVQTRQAKMKAVFVEYIDHLEIYQKYNKKCFYCNKKITFLEMEIDHFIPIALNGKHEKSNIRAACFKCNRSKGCKHPKDVHHQMV